MLEKQFRSERPDVFRSLKIIPINKHAKWIYFLQRGHSFSSFFPLLKKWYLNGKFCQRINQKKRDYIVRLLSTNKTTAPHIGLLGVLITYSEVLGMSKTNKIITTRNEAK